MNGIIVALQIIIALTIVNVWLVRRGRATPWRGGSARTLREEFEVYGLPRWAMSAVGALKLTLAAALIAAIAFPVLRVPAALGLASLMLGAVAMHVKVGDPLRRSVPALTVLALSIVVVVA